MNYLHHQYRAGLEIGEFDRYSIPFGIVSRNRREVIASLRIVLPDEQPYDSRDPYEAVTGHCLDECPACHHGHMIVVDVIPKPSSRYRFCCDTS